jgi:hypothetical protein
MKRRRGNGDKFAPVESGCRLGIDIIGHDGLRRERAAQACALSF